MRDYHIYMNRTKAACFACRKSWAWDRNIRKNSANLCPQCGRLLCFVGLDFKSPKKLDVKQWLKVEQLVRAGIYFSPKYTEMGGPGPRPRYLREVANFLLDQEKDQNRILRDGRLRARAELVKQKREKREIALEKKKV